jgi:hypothetical protein
VRGAAIVFRASSIGLAILTASLIGIAHAGPNTFLAAITFFFCYSILSVGFGMADTHVLFRLTPVESPARTLVAASVSVGLAAAIVPFVVGLGLERGLEATSDRLLVYHVFFAIAASIQSITWWPTRGFGPDGFEAGTEMAAERSHA